MTVVAQTLSRPAACVAQRDRSVSLYFVSSLSVLPYCWLSETDSYHLSSEAVVGAIAHDSSPVPFDSFHTVIHSSVSTAEFSVPAAVFVNTERDNTNAMIQIGLAGLHTQQDDSEND